MEGTAIMAIAKTAMLAAIILVLNSLTILSSYNSYEEHRDPDPPDLKYLKTDVIGLDRCAILGEWPMPGSGQTGHHLGVFIIMPKCS